MKKVLLGQSRRNLFTTKEKAQVMRFFSLLLCILMLASSACSRNINFKTVIDPPRHCAGVGGPYPISVEPISSDSSIYKYIKSYIETSPHWRLQAEPAQEKKGEYLLKWKVLNTSYAGDIGTKKSVVIYLYCSVICAWLAPIWANISTWHVTQYIELDLTLLDQNGQEVYHNKKGLAVNETDKTLPRSLELKKAMYELTAQKIVNQMMNRMVKVVLILQNEESNPGG